MIPKHSTKLCSYALSLSLSLSNLHPSSTSEEREGVGDTSATVVVKREVLAKTVDIVVVRGPLVVSPGDDSNTSLLLLLGPGGEGEGGEREDGEGE